MEDVFEGCCHFRQRLMFSLLCNKPLVIQNIRTKDENVGMRDFEIKLLELLDKITKGMKIEINDTGTTLKFSPGVLCGGKVEHDCGVERGVGYFLEMIMPLAPFCKVPLQLTLHGVTNDPVDPSVDRLKFSTVKLISKFIGSDEGIELKIIRRGAKPDGGGEVFFTCPTKMKLRPVQLLNSGKIKRIRGVAYTLRVAPSISNRMINAVKPVFLKFIPDVYIISEAPKGPNAGNSPCFGISLVAETTEGVFYCAEYCSQPKGSDVISTPEEVGTEACRRLVLEIFKGGCVDSFNQGFLLLYMALNQPDVSKAVTGILTDSSIQLMRYLKQFFQLTFKIAYHSVPDAEDLKLGGRKLVISCIGANYQNINKALV